VIAGDHVDLSLSALFRSLAPASVKRWLRSAKERRVPRGGFYFRQDEPAMDLYLLTKGTVKLVRTERDGRSAILRLVLPAEPFGYVDALGATSRIASAQAAEESRALCWDVPTMLRELMTHPKVSLSTIRVLAEDVRRSVDRAQELAMSPVDRRLARLLLGLAESVGRKTSRGIVIRLALSGEELGEMIAVTPYTVSRVLAEWRRLDVVDAQPGRILILNPERLRAVADEHQAKPARIQGTRPTKLNR